MDHLQLTRYLHHVTITITIPGTSDDVEALKEAVKVVQREVMRRESYRNRSSYRPNDYY